MSFFVCLMYTYAKKTLNIFFILKYYTHVRTIEAKQVISELPQFHVLVRRLRTNILGIPCLSPKR